MACNADPLSTIETPAKVWGMRQWYSLAKFCLYMFLSVLLNVIGRPLGWLLIGIDRARRILTGRR